MSNLYTYSKNGMKMLINSGFKTFDKQTNFISQGNVISNTQYSNYIRNYNETECNGIMHKEGELQKYDLQFFKHIPSSLLEHIKNSDKEMVLYEFYIYTNGVKDVIGYLLQENNIITETRVVGYNLMRLGKRYNALMLCKAIIEEKI